MIKVLMLKVLMRLQSALILIGLKVVVNFQGVKNLNIVNSTSSKKNSLHLQKPIKNSLHTPQVKEKKDLLVAFNSQRMSRLWTNKV